MSAGVVAITGLGIFCGAGKDIPSFTDALMNGKSGVAPLDLFDVSDFPSKIGVQVKEYDPLDHFDRKAVSRLSRADQFGVIAAGEALRASGIGKHCSPYDMGVVVGGGAAGMFQSEQWLKERIAGRKGRPSLLRGLLPDKASTVIAETFGLAGYQGTITTACSSSATAIGWGADLVSSGRLKAVVCGGTDTLSLLTFAGFNSLRVVDPEPCSPFSLGRQGISLGEGAAFMVLEDADAARQRGATVYGHVRGYAAAGEAYHMTAPEPSGTAAARVMTEAMRIAGIDAGAVGWVNAHGTGTPLNDAVESKAMKLVFGEGVANVPLVSTKALTGHCLGAAGAVEGVATVIALNEGIIPQTLHFRGRDPECDLDYCHDGPRASGATVALSNSFAFGGNITTLVLSR
ncbi:Beta-ketoacyl synthase [Geobacter metallireducens RCH3]|uniref:3-oxoacyl-(Acyl carrier protein) synthase II n=1 Tax=Geobacter metallireducens (strain ATCC 53774 / DSM 7210 / GS-15) TaxID=269799 RepID=Q39UZ8_GEOMG|nr:beta-ketoacyl-[acyl-carrier-protein] synthase family protein [Geobacter metallireducens]ABB31926.1 3-oxoacyl-(acyl carrier protein) synthase II [Geobacter metallireducens GS-15]EHP84972.1 Beta-ketoacyl synthase [Geobacter metallireducens RCH3]